MSLTIKASDTDLATNSNETVALNSGGLPTGATLTPVLPVSGNPVSAVFNWTPTSANVGSHVLNFTATDNCGAQTICSFTIEVSACSPINVAITGNQTVYTGYDPAACTTLTAKPTGGTLPYKYAWDNGATTASITVCPTADKTYSVVVTDAAGCKSAVVKVPVKVVNVACAHKKAYVCHIPPGNSGNLHTICVSVNAVEEHLSHGDYLGQCASGLVNGGVKGSTQLVVAPNPIKGLSLIQFALPSSEVVSVELYDLQGRIRSQLYKGYVEGNMIFTTPLDAEALPNGMYIIKLQGESVQQVFKVNILK